MDKNRTTSTPSAAELAGRDALRQLADQSVCEKAARLVLDGEASWQYDPDVRGVVGLIDGATDKAFIVVYLEDQDFETSEDFDNCI